MSSDTETLGAAFTNGVVEADGFTLRYWRAGAGDPVLVLHPAGGPRHSIALDLLAEQFDVVQLQMPGWGDQPNDAAQTFDDLAESVAAAAAALGLEQYHVLGSSVGGATALHLAVAHPDRVISLVMEGPAEFRDGVRPPNEIPPEEFARAFRLHPERPPVQSPPDPDAMARVWPLVGRMTSGPAYDEEFAAKLGTCPVRTLVLFGTADGVMPPHNGRTYRRLLPSCCYLLVHDAAHDVQGDRPEAFAEVVGDFLRRGMVFLVPEDDTLLNA